MDVFGALSDPVRRDLLVALAEGPSRVADLAARHAISRPAISRHLRHLAEAGLVTAEQHGRERHQVLRHEALEPVRDLLVALTGEGHRELFPPGTLDALDTEVRRTRRERRTSDRAPRTGAGKETA